MTIASTTPSYISNNPPSSIIGFSSNPMVRRNSLQSPKMGFGTNDLPRRSSLSSISKVKSLQCIDKKRRYLRRGSKTSDMMRIAGSFRVELPALDDSTRSCTSSWSNASVSSPSLSSRRSVEFIPPAFNEASPPDQSSGASVHLPSSPPMKVTCLGTVTTTSLRNFHSPRPTPPVLLPKERRSRTENVVSVLSSALSLFTIQDFACVTDESEELS